MTASEFDNLLGQVTDSMKAILGSKADQYARGDRLSNFKTAGRRLGCAPERALLGMMEKHSTAIADYVNDLDHNHIMPQEQWNEKIIDSINYLVLLLALVSERIPK